MRDLAAVRSRRQELVKCALLAMDVTGPAVAVLDRWQVSSSTNKEVVEDLVRQRDVPVLPGDGLTPAGRRSVRWATFEQLPCQPRDVMAPAG